MGSHEPRLQDVASGGVVVGPCRPVLESEQALRAMFELSPDAASISRLRDGAIIDVNEPFELLTGWRKENALGHSFVDLGIWGTPRDRDRLVAQIEKEGIVHAFETRIRTRKGSIRDVLVAGRILGFGGEETLVTMIRDVTELNRGTRRYRLLAENSQDVIWTLDLASSRFSYVSPAVQRLRGLTVDEALAEPLDQSLTPESLDRIAAIMAPSPAPGDAGFFTGVFDQPCTDGTVKHVEITTSYVRNEEGRPIEILGVSRDATARVEAERALERRADELRTVLQTALDGFASVDREGCFAEVNEALCALSGYTRQELIGTPVASLEVEDDPFVLAERRHRIASTGAARFETRYRRKDGVVVDVEVSVRLAPGEGAPCHAFVRDVTERKRAEVKLRESSRRLATLVRVARIGFLVTRLSDRQVVDVNEAWCSQLGWSREELAGRTTLELGVWVEPGHRERIYQRLAAGEDILGEKIRVVRRSGEEADFVFTGQCAEIGGETCVIAAWHDVTALNRADAALRANEARFRTLIERSSDLIVLLDREGNALFWSPSAEEFLGWTAADTMGQPLLGRVHPDDQPRLADALARLLVDGTATERVAFRAARKGGGWRSLEGLCRNLLADPAVGALVMNVRDMTQHQLLEEQVRQSQKLESIGRLAGGIAHDFNNLLTVILSCAQAMRRDRSEGREVAPDDIAEVHAAGERARDLTRQLLAFARKQVIEPVPLDLNRVVRGSERLLARLVGEDVQVVAHLAPDLWPTMADVSQIEQVLVNLAVNARDAMGGRGTLEIATRNVEASDHGPEAREGDWVSIAVRDTGAGMTPEVVAHIFEPFFTTKEQGKGTGLGLATVHGIVAQSGGHIHVESEPGRGSTLRICLPRTTRSGIPVVAAETPQQLEGTETLLVVEDDPLVRAVTVRALAGRGYKVLPADGGEEAISLARTHPGPIHLVVTDVVMPGMDGRQVAEGIARSRPGTQVLFVSGYPQEVIAERGVLDAGVNLLPKPFTPDALAGRVRSLLDQPGPDSGLRGR